MAYFKNASPQVIHLGADDKSGRIVTPSTEPIPQHCPLFYIFAEKGPTSRLLLPASKLNTIYGDKTFNVNEKFYNHQTRFLLGVAGEANSCIVHRLVPEDAGVKANRVVWMDVLETEVPNYKRDSYGSYAVDAATNEYIKDDTNPTIPGYKIKYIAETLDANQDAGALKPKNGTMSETVSKVPVIPDTVQASINGLRVKYSVDEYIELDGLVTAESEYEVSSSNTTFVGYDATAGKWKALDVGSAELIFKFKATDTKEESTIKVTITVVGNGTTLSKTAQDVKVLGAVNLVDTTTDYFNLVVSTTDTTVTPSITVADTAIATVANNTVTGVANGSTYVNVYVPDGTDDSGDTKPGVAYLFTLQSKVVALDPVETVNTSTMYPLIEATAMYQGAAYNNLGFAIAPLTGDDVDTSIVSGIKSMVYKMAFFTRTDSSSSPSVFRSLYSEPYVQFSPKEKAINPNTEGRIDFETVYESNWWNETDELKSLRYFDYENFYFYREYFEEVCKMFLAKEKQFVSDEDVEWADGKYASTATWYNFTTVDQTELDDEYLIMNPISCQTSEGVNYFTLVKDNESNPTLTGTQKEVLMSTDTPVFLQGGSDGTVSDDEFEKLVVADMQKYADADSEYQDIAVNVESTFYDSGFSLATKKELINFILLRKDTDIVLSTHYDTLGDKSLSLSDSRAIAEALKARYKLAPESEYFGTTVARGIVVMGSGKLRDGSTKNRIPLSYEIALKAADMMGSSTGNWDKKQIFDNYPGNALEYLIDPQPNFIPAGIKPTLWNDGIVWVQPYDRSSYHFPALQTIYEDDTSVLNNFFVMKALGQLTKLSDRVWRKYTGTSSLNNAEFIEVVTEYCNKLLSGKFDSVVTVIPEVIIDDEDENRGYSWHLVWKLYGDNMKTVLVAHTEVYRSSDLTSSSES